MNTSTRYVKARDQLLRAMPRTMRRRYWFWRWHRRWLPLRHPVTFTDKMNWRILRDRRPLLDGTCDKLAMKEYAESHRGELPLRIATTYWSGTDVEELARVELPPEWVLKPNHRSHVVLFGSGEPDIADLRERTRGWLDELNWSMLGEWAYSRARRRLVVEERIGGPDAVPTEYLVFVFDGVARMIQVVEGGLALLTQRCYTAAWEPLSYKLRTPLGPIRPAPPELSRLLEIAGHLGQGFDFIRVDFLVHDGEIWFGELTPYSQGGTFPAGTPDLDAMLGGFWHLPDVTG
jgi:TupA-like ATPgrasp